MRALLINTCGADGLVGIADDGSVLDVERLPGRSAGEQLIPAVRRLLESRGWRVSELAAIGVVVGPGSFTGVRVGLSAAKGLCEAGGVGMIGMSRLALLAAAQNTKDTVVAVLDAGRGEYYCGVYRDGARVSEELLRAEAAEALLQEAAGVTCEERVSQVLGARVELVPEPGAEEMLAMVSARMAAGEWSDVATQDANYLRRTDAELLVKGR